MTRALYRSTDPETSEIAANSVSVAWLEHVVLDRLRRYPNGLTTHELGTYLGIYLVSVSPRMAPLRSKGLICDSGKRRAGSSGRKSIVWKALVA